MGIFHSMDTDGSADISIEEFTAFLKQRSEMDNEDIDQENEEDRNKSQEQVQETKSSDDDRRNQSKGSRNTDPWARSTSPPTPSVTTRKTASVPELTRLSATSDDILDRSGSAIVVKSKENTDNNVSSRRPMSPGDSWSRNERVSSPSRGNIDSLGSTRDSPPRQGNDEKGGSLKPKQIHSIPQPKTSTYSRSSTESSFEDLDLLAMSTQNKKMDDDDDDNNDSFEKGRIVIPPPKPKDTTDIKKKAPATQGATAKRYLDMQKAKSERMASSHKTDTIAASGIPSSSRNNTSKSVDFTDPDPVPSLTSMPQENIKMNRAQSESAATRSQRPPLPVKASVSNYPNTKLSAFRIRSNQSLSEGEESSGAVDNSAATAPLPPPQTEIGAVMGVVLEGWLEKKSTVTGLFQKRFVVLAFGKASHMREGRSSAGEACMELRIFKRAVESAWGNAPIEVLFYCPAL